MFGVPNMYTACFMDIDVDKSQCVVTFCVSPNMQFSYPICSLHSPFRYSAVSLIDVYTTHFYTTEKQCSMISCNVINFLK